MRPLRVVGLSPDDSRLLLQDEAEQFEVPLADVAAEISAARRSREAGQDPAPAADRGAPPTPREVQERIRRGESAAEIAEQAGVPVAAVARWESPVLAERAHHALQARRVQVGERTVDEHVEAYARRMLQDPPPVTWDSWQTGVGRWEVRGRCGRVLVRLL